uniref:Potassium channel tetramerisation-type BTB domain-containing protein n=1 Tax=Aceria tosichella TaxID=561515 RepID=A0A6G1SMR7_9ACAR
MELGVEDYIELDVGQKIFLCPIKTIEKHPESLLAKSIKQSSSNEKGSTISIECDPKYFQLIMDFMRDGQLSKLQSLSYYETQQLCNEAKFFGLDELVKLCESRIASHFKGYGGHWPEVIIDRSELESVLERAKRTGEYTVLLNVDRLSRDTIQEMCDLASRDKFTIISCHGQVTAYSSEFYQAGRLIKCSNNADDLLSYVYHSHTGIML